MKHRISDTLCAISLVLFALVLVIWIRSYFHGAYYSFDVRPAQERLVKNGAQIQPVHRAKVISAENGRIVVSDMVTAHSVMFGHTINSVRLMPVFAVLLILPGCWSVLGLRRKPGTCPVCGYDLRATPDHCPECGKIVQRVI
jgi:hypothetical protein